MPLRTPETDKQTHEKESEPCIRDFANTDASTSAPLSRLSLAFAQLLDTLLARIASLAALLSSPAYAPVNEITDQTTPITTPAPSMSSIISATTKTVVVLGCAYGGARAAQILAAGLPAAWRLIVLDRNSHANHVYVMPRFAVLPGHEYKAFIPYTNVFLQNKPAAVQEEPEKNPEDQEKEEKEAGRFTVLHAQVTALRANSVTFRTLSPPSANNTSDKEEAKEETLDFDFAIYALGAHMPPPLDLWGSAAPSPSSGNVYSGLKTEGCAFFVDKQAEIARVQGGRVLVVGGGALGIQFATDIKAVYPNTAVTLLHSRERLLPRFEEGMHEEVLRSCATLGVDVILGERLDLGSLSTKEISDEGGDVCVQKVVRTVTGREIVADLVLMCTGQTPNTGLLADLDKALVEPRSRHARVHRTMQVASRTVYDEDSSAASAALATATIASTTASVTASTDVTKDAEEALAQLALNETPDANDAKDTTVYPYPHIFAIGDAAAAFGAIPAGHNAYAQGEVAARNVLRLIKRAETSEKTNEKREEELEELEEYTPGPPAIKVSLGLERGVYQVGPNIGVKTDGVPDLQAAAIWPYFGIEVEKDEDMRA